jgi:hypothetical protein
MKIIKYLLILLLIVEGCKNQPLVSGVYPEKKNLTNKAGIPYDSTASYLPDELSGQNLNYDNSNIGFSSKTLYAFKEPLLFNYYKNNEIIRLLWNRSVSKPVLIKIERNGKQVSITTKILNRHPDYIERTVNFKPPGLNGEKLPDPPARPPLQFILNKKRKIPENEWYTIINKLYEIKYFQMEPSEVNDWCRVGGTDWLLETHLPGGYYYVYREDPKKELYEFCKYLIKISDAKNEKL